MCILCRLYVRYKLPQNLLQLIWNHGHINIDGNWIEVEFPGQGMTKHIHLDKEYSDTRMPMLQK